MTDWRGIVSLFAPSWLIAAALVAPAVAAPEISNVNIRGLQIGATTTITIDGSDLLPEPRILSSLPIAAQNVQTGAAANRVVFELTLDESVEPGMYNLWLANAAGVSGKVVVAADHLPQQPFANEIAALPVALHGAIGGSTKLRTAFDGKADQELLFEVEAQRLGGKLRPVLHLYDAVGKHLAWSLPSPALRGDTRLEATLPADGKYTLELHDLQYAAPAPNFFRLKIGAWQFADAVFPVAVERGKPASLELVGNVPDGQRIAFTASAVNLETPVPWLSAAASSGIRPGVSISSFPEAIEAPPAEGLQTFPAVPSAVNGRLSAPGEQDRFLLAVKPGDQLRFDLFADRIGSPMDALLELLNEQGARLAVGDDIAGSADARLDYTVPAGVEKIVVSVKDVNAGGGPRCIYRVAVAPLDPAALPDFSLKLEQDRHSVPQGDRLVVKVIADRQGYDGPIELRFDDLPAGVQVQGDIIPAGASATLLTLHGAGTQAANVLTAFRGESVAPFQLKKGDPPLVRFAADSQHPVGQFQPWLTTEYAVAISKPSAVGFGIAVGTLPDDASLVLGGRLQAPVQCVRPVGFDGPVRLTLVTSHTPPLTNGQPDQNRTLRQETPNFEMASDSQAVAAYDAKLAAEKVVTDAQTNAATVAATGKKTRDEAAAKVKEATDAKAAADKGAADAAAALKAAQTAQAATDVAFVKATEAAATAAKASTDAADVAKKADPADKPATDAKAAEASKSAAEAAKLLEAAATKKAADDKAAADAAVTAKAAADAQTVAVKALADAEANAKAAIAAADQADAQAAAQVKQASDNLAAADKAAVVASALAKNDGALSVIVPSDLPAGGYELAIRAELLSRNKQSVLARSVTQVRRFGILNPIAVALNGPANIEAQIDPQAGATVALAGKVQRRAGQASDVTVTLSGLPGGIAVPSAVVKPDQTDFLLEVTFPANFQPAMLGGIKLFATGKMEANLPDVRSEEVAITIDVQAQK